MEIFLDSVRVGMRALMENAQEMALGMIEGQGGDRDNLLRLRSRVEDVVSIRMQLNLEPTAALLSSACLSRLLRERIWNGESRVQTLSLFCFVLQTFCERPGSFELELSCVFAACRRRHRPRFERRKKRMERHCSVSSEEHSAIGPTSKQPRKDTSRPETKDAWLLCIPASDCDFSCLSREPERSNNQSCSALDSGNKCAAPEVRRDPPSCRRNRPRQVKSAQLN